MQAKETVGSGPGFHAVQALQSPDGEKLYLLDKALYIFSPQTASKGYGVGGNLKIPDPPSS